MKLTAQVKLQPTPEQADALKRTLEAANAACNSISDMAWQSKTFGQYKLHHLVYTEVRATFGLSAQMTVRCEAKVADAYKLDKDTKRTFFSCVSCGFSGHADTIAATNIRARRRGVVNRPYVSDSAAG